MIFSIGHSNRTIGDFIELIHTYHLEHIVDVRGGNFIGSKTFPHFNKANLNKVLPDVGVKYTHIGFLGGKRPKIPTVNDSLNGSWTVDAFKNYADYAYESNDFQLGLHELLTIASSERTAYMCAEAVPWRCHRRIITDYIKAFTDQQVIHIISNTQTLEGVCFGNALIYNDKLIYPVRSAPIDEQGKLFEVGFRK